MNLYRDKVKNKGKNRGKSKYRNKDLIMEYGKVKGLPGLVCLFRRADNRQISGVLPLLCEVFDDLSEDELLDYIKETSKQTSLLRTTTRLETGQMSFLIEHLNTTSLVPLEILDLKGLSDFALSVYKVLYRTRFGEILTYSELADRSGYKGSARAVGTAMRKNPLPMIIPCHRVKSKSGVENFSISCLKKRPVGCRLKDSKACAGRIKAILRLA